MGHGRSLGDATLLEREEQMGRRGPGVCVLLLLQLGVPALRLKNAGLASAIVGPATGGPACQPPRLPDELHPHPGGGHFFRQWPQ